MKRSRLFDGISYLINQVLIPNLIWMLILNIPSAVWGIRQLITVISQLTAQGTAISKDVFMACLGIGICLLSLILSIVYLLHQLITRKSRAIFPAINADYKILSSEFELIFTDREHIIQRQTITFRILSDKLSEIPHSLTWTGQKYICSDLSEESKRKGFHIEESERSVPPYRLIIRFPERERGFEDTYSFESRVEDATHQMIPMLGRHIKCQTQQLTLRITVPNDGFVHNMERFISADVHRDVVLSDRVSIAPQKIGNMIIYEWKPRDLELLHYYFITWEFGDEAKR